jgi:hypothetical protein
MLDCGAFCMQLWLPRYCGNHDFRGRGKYGRPPKNAGTTFRAYAVQNAWRFGHPYEVQEMRSEEACVVRGRLSARMGEQTPVRISQQRKRYGKGSRLTDYWQSDARIEVHHVPPPLALLRRVDLIVYDEFVNAVRKIEGSVNDPHLGIQDGRSLRAPRKEITHGLPVGSMQRTLQKDNCQRSNLEIKIGI